MEKFAIKVDLSVFFEDERKLTMLLVDPGWTTMKCLQQKLRSLFDLEAVHFTTEDGCYIPLEESIEVLGLPFARRSFLPHKPEQAKSKKRKSLQDGDEFNNERLISNDIENCNLSFYAQSIHKSKLKKNTNEAGFENDHKGNKHDCTEKTKNQHFSLEEIDKSLTFRKPLITFFCSLEKKSLTKPRIFKAKNYCVN